VHVVTDGRRAVEEIREREPDVVVVDSLLQGRADARKVVESLRASGSPIGIVALTVPDRPMDGAMSKHADAVVTLPFGTIELGRGIIDAHVAAAARDPSASSRIVTVFSPKGGVGTTTIAYNLAASLAGTGLRTLLIDGSLQFGGVRRLLRADPTAPSICDLPTDVVRSADLADTVIRDAWGVDVLLAPPRPELAELVNGRDLEQLLGVLRRAYQAIVVDTPSALSEPTLAFLDAADLIIDVLTADPVTLDVTRLIAATFAEIGYPPAKVRYLVNRYDEVGAVPAAQLTRVLGREPDFRVASDWQLVSSSNADGIPYVLARPDAAASADLRRVTESVRALSVTPSGDPPARRRNRNH
jgi:pilus assembly protein CpaE